MSHMGHEIYVACLLRFSDVFTMKRQTEEFLKLIDANDYTRGKHESFKCEQIEQHER